MSTPAQPNRRHQRVAELLKREVGELIRRELSVEEVGILSVNEVGLARDLRSATVFIGFVGTASQRRAAPEKLEARTPRIQQLLGAVIRLKFTPQLKFVLDDSVERGNRVLAILDELEKPQPPAPPSGRPPSSAR